jgi:hypothetical protein
MKPVTKQNIDDFLNCETLAIAGASRDPKSFSAIVANHLSKLGYKLWFINPEFNNNETDLLRIQSVTELPPGITRLLVLTPANQTDSVIQMAIAKGIQNIWIQQQSETPLALEAATQININLIHHQCIFMFTQPKGIHKFHYRLKKIFGGIPK